MTQTGVWTTQGFDGFRRGTFGNAGHNLYVSRAGVLQRIHQYDLNKNGYFDLVFANDHDHGENAPAYVYRDPLGNASRYEVPSDGAWSGAMADLNGDGYDDLVLGMLSNGSHPRLNSFIYYGSADGFSERRRRLLPAPLCVSVAAGDFNGDGKPDLAYLCSKEDGSSETYVRIFYQTDLGFESHRYEDIEIDGGPARRVRSRWRWLRRSRRAIAVGRSDGLLGYFGWRSRRRGFAGCWWFRGRRATRRC